MKRKINKLNKECRKRKLFFKICSEYGDCYTIEFHSEVEKRYITDDDTTKLVGYCNGRGIKKAIRNALNFVQSFDENGIVK